MTSPVAAIASVVGGVILALFAVIGGVGAVASGPNAASASEEIVRYDAP